MNLISGCGISFVKNDMHMRILYFFLPVLIMSCTSLKPTRDQANLSQLILPFERDTNQSCTWQEAIYFYRQMAKLKPEFARLQTIGRSDGGSPLDVFILSTAGVFDPEKARRTQKTILLINNGIHPGEPEGIDASIRFARGVLQDTLLQSQYRNLVFLIIPVYNVDGALRRNQTSRANQNGPAEYGFRGNARNLDLNRDFIKCDSENARAFIRLFHTWNPDLLLDNHTSNGADYQHTMTLLPTLHSKLAPTQAYQLNSHLLPYLYKQMEMKGWPMAPYVNELATTPDSGIVGFLDYPRFASGFAALFHCIGLTSETHMLKSFAQRLCATHDLMQTIAAYAAKHGAELRNERIRAQQYWASAPVIPLDWAPQLESTTDSVTFMGYEASYRLSQVHQGSRLFYDRTKPYRKRIPLYNTFAATSQVRRPQAYVVPQAWREVVDRLRQNQVSMYALASDTVLQVTLYRIKEFQSREAYEGHYLHYKIKADPFTHLQQYRAGDWVIPVPTSCNTSKTCPVRYIIETLEPTAPDGFFAWNFFDATLMQKEYFSAYVFEDLAYAYLQDQPTLRNELAIKMAADLDFAKNGNEVLRWVYMRSPWYEGSARVYPVGRIE